MDGFGNIYMGRSYFVQLILQFWHWEFPKLWERGAHINGGITLNGGKKHYHNLNGGQGG